MNRRRRKPEFLPQVPDPRQKDLVVKALAAILDVWHAHPELSKVGGPDIVWGRSEGSPDLYANILYTCGIKEHRNRELEPYQLLPTFTAQMSICARTEEEAAYWQKLFNQRFHYLLIQWEEGIAIILVLCGGCRPYHKERQAFAASLFDVCMFQSPDVRDAAMRVCEWVEKHYTPKREKGCNEFPNVGGSCPKVGADAGTLPIIT